MSIKHSLKTKHILTGQELNENDLKSILKTAEKLKQSPDQYGDILKGKSLVMVFDKPSFRTRLSFSLAMQSLGGMVVESIEHSRKSEVPKDLMRVLNGYCDFVMMRIHSDSVLEEMSCYANMPLINGLTDLYHPCQIIADLMTIKEYFGAIKGVTTAYIGDGNNILHSLMLMAPKMGIKVKFCCPRNSQPKQQIIDLCNSSMVKQYDSSEETVSQADVVYTDVWTSIGFERKADEQNFKGFQVNENIMSLAKKDAIFMHCMPMNRGKEVSETLPDRACSVIFDQSENRLHAQKALLLFLGGVTENCV